MKKLRESDPVRGIHLLFVWRVEAGRLQQVLRASQREGVFAVTENEKGLELGAAINFLTEDRVGFEVSLESAEKTGHRISSRMLTVARRVIPKAS